MKGHQKQFDDFFKYLRDIQADLIHDSRQITIDGPIEPEYFQQDQRILWVLKEPHGGGGESLVSYVQRQNNPDKDRFADQAGKQRYSHWFVTYGKIIKVSKLLLEPSENEEKVLTSNPRKYEDILDKVAIINLNKFGGGATVSENYPEIFKMHKDLICWQLENLEPDIIICGNTFPLLYKTIFGEEYHKPEILSPSNVKYPSYKDEKGAIYVSAYHPACRKKAQAYHDNILKATKNAGLLARKQSLT